jgi:hypothetical protein
MIKLRGRHFVQLALVICLAGFGLLVYMAKKIIDGGLYADATHTPGAIPLSQIILTLLALMMIICSIVLFFAVLRKTDRSEPKK